MSQLNLDSNSQKATVFLHIPKTAGTTLYTILDRHFTLKHTVSIYSEPEHIVKFKEIEELSSDQQSKIELIKGHTYLGWHKILPQEVNYFTLLRNPLDRFISHYYYIKNLTSHPLHKFINEKNISLTDFALMKGQDNGQTRFLATIVGEGEIEFKSQECSTAILEKAKRNIREYCGVIGIVEEFDKGLLLLKKNFAWKNIFYIVKNKNKARVSTREISKETLKIIEKQHQFDLELYEYSKNIFHQMIAEQDEKFEQDLHDFQNLNTAPYGRFSVITATSAVKFQKLICSIGRMTI